MLAVLEAVKQLAKAVTADYDQNRRYVAKYHSGQDSKGHLAIDLVQKVGLQMMAAVRVMQALDQARVPLLPQMASRLIRHVYGAEIHWRSRIQPGVSIVHGCGLVVSHAASIGSGCILFQNVTLGESVDPETRQVGAPILGNDVHIGPGATLIGPITVGERTKIMAGAVLTRSVPPDSLVRPGESIITTRRGGTTRISDDRNQSEGHEQTA